MSRVRNVPITIPKHKLWRGKSYILDQIYTTHAEAERETKAFRKVGFPVKVVRSGSWYLIYVGRLKS